MFYYGHLSCAVVFSFFWGLSLTSFLCFSPEDPGISKKIKAWAHIILCCFAMGHTSENALAYYARDFGGCKVLKVHIDHTFLKKIISFTYRQIYMCCTPPCLKSERVDLTYLPHLL